MNEVQIFIYRNRKIRTVMLKGEPWWVAKDVCEILEITNASDAIKRLEEDEVTRFNLGGLSGETNMVNEPGMYSLILGSRKPEAKAFKRWITHEVIPSIRRHGMYAADELLDNPDLMIRVLTELKTEREQKIMLQRKVEKDKRKVIFADAVTESKTSILIGDLAKIIKQNGVNIGPKRLFEWLRANGYLMKSGQSKNMPTQRSMELGLFEVKESIIVKPYGENLITRTTKVTGKGQMHLINALLNEPAG